MRRYSLHREPAAADWRKYQINPYVAGAMVAGLLSMAIVFTGFVVAWRYVF